MVFERHHLKNYLKEVKSLRHDWEDKIPNETLHSTTRMKSQKGVPKFKVRIAWFSCVGLSIKDGLRKGYLDSSFSEVLNNFRKYVIKTKLGEKPTTKKDIKYANGILDGIISHVEGKLRSM